MNACRERAKFGDNGLSMLTIVRINTEFEINGSVLQEVDRRPRVYGLGKP